MIYFAIFIVHTNLLLTGGYNVMDQVEPETSSTEPILVELTVVNQVTLALPEIERGMLTANKNYLWIIHTTEQFTMQIDVGPFNISGTDNNCTEDYVRVGVNETTKEQDSKRCGENNTIKQEVDGQKMYFQLHTGNSTTTKAFNVTITRIPKRVHPIVSCDKPMPIDLTAVSQAKIALPESAGTLLGQKDCLWTINTTKDYTLLISYGPFNLNYSGLSCNKDYLRVGPDETRKEGDPKSCGGQGPIDKNVDGQKAYFELHTETKTTSKPFNVVVKRVLDGPNPVLSCDHPILVELTAVDQVTLGLQETEGTLSEKKDCVWTIQTSDQFVLQVEVGPFNITGTDKNCTGDFVRVGVNETTKEQDPKRCGENNTIMQDVNGQNLYFQLHTENSTTTKLFNVSVKRVPKRVDPVVLCDKPMPVDLKIVSRAKIQLPESAGTLLGSKDCLWRITTPELFIPEIEVGPFSLHGIDKNCTGDYLRVGRNETISEQDPKRCGLYSTIVQTEDGQNMYFQLHTENATAAKTFDVVIKRTLVNKPGNSSLNSVDRL